MHVSVKEDALAFELTPAAPKVVKAKPAKKAPAKRKPKPAAESNGDQD